VSGYGGAALSGANLARQAGAYAPSAGAGAALGGLGGALGIYNGIKQGGVKGYTGAALGAAQLYGAASTADVAAGGAGFAGAGAASAVGAYAGPLAALYALYGLDQKQSVYSPLAYANDAKNSAAGIRAAQLTPYNAPGSRGYNPMYAAAAEQYAKSMDSWAQEALSGNFANLPSAGNGPNLAFAGGVKMS